jgi:hypothetical protein
MNEWSGAYILITFALGAGVVARLRAGHRLHWGRLLLWTLSAGLMAIVTWGILACSVLPFTGEIDWPSGIREWGYCVAGSSFWSSFIIAVALPFYLVLLAWYIFYFGRELRGWPSVVRAVGVLSLPPAVALSYGYTFPVYDSLSGAAARAVPFVVLGYLAVLIALLLPRLVIPALAPGQLIAKDAA